MKNKQRFVVYALRHNPSALGLRLDRDGWCDVKAILRSLGTDLKGLEEIVAQSGERLVFNEDRTKIRASHGHSVNVELPMNDNPPEKLFHGTARSNIQSIMENGLLPMGRRYVHLSETKANAIRVAKRHSSNIVVLEIDTSSMTKDGFRFCRSEDGVWLTDSVDKKYICFGNKEVEEKR